MSTPRRSARISYLTAASEQRQAAKTEKTKVPVPIPADDFGTAHIKQMDISCYWRDKLYDDVAVEDWYFTISITMSDGTKKTSTFWFNSVYIQDAGIFFGCGDHIGIHKGRVCLILSSPFRETYYIPFAPHITFPMVKGAFLPILKTVGHNYMFDFECPKDVYPSDFVVPHFRLGF